MLNHPWLKQAANYDVKMNEEEFERMMIEVKDRE